MSRLQGSVGDGGRNVPSDVKAVQYLLSVRGMNPGVIDSICGRKTIAAIERFQYQFMSNPDGIVDVDGMTWRRLAGQPATTRPPVSGRSPAPTPPRTPASPPPARTPTIVAPPSSSTGSLVEEVPIPRGDWVNRGVQSLSNSFMMQKFGEPRPAKDYDFEGKSPTNRRLAAMMTYGVDVGPFKVSGMAPAVASLKQIMEDIRREQFHAYSELKTWGMLNVRWVKSKTNRARAPQDRYISNHSWGAAIDLSFKNHRVDDVGDNKVYFGLALIAPIFNRHGWYWGATFGTEDGMHFEAGRALVTGWASLS
jgi:hypothetical protein